MAGIDKSDFQPPGRPQLSSTIRPHFNGAASLARGECRNVWAKTDAPSLVRVCRAMFGKRLPCGCAKPALDISVSCLHVVEQ